MDGANYILPADVPEIGAGQVTRLTGAAVSEDYITAELLRSGARIAVVVLDACRDNPFARPGTKGVGGEKGLQPRRPAERGVSFYAANRGEAALDRLSDGDRNPNSVYPALVPALTRPGLDLPALAVEVREEVTRLARTVRHEQHPAYYDGTSGGRVFLAGLPRDGAGQAGAGGAALLGGMAAPAGPAADEVAWSFVKDSRDADLVRRFIAQYPASPRRAEAVRRLAELERAPQSGIQTAAVVPPVAPAVPPADPCAGVVTVSFSSRCAAPLTAAQERGLKPKDSFRERENCPEMVVVPAGSFTMGSPENEKGRDKKDDKDESPQHVVTIAKPFAVDKFDVTKAQFAAFVAETKYDAGSNCYAYENNKWVEKRGRSWRDPGFAQDGTHPAVCLNWDDATAYVDWLARKTGKPYRLLTEAEWEYAARGRTAPDRIRGFGSAMTRRICAVTAMGRTRPGGTGSSGPTGSHPVGTAMRRHHRSGALPPTRLGFTICWAMLGSGRRIAITTVIKAHRRMARRGQSEIAVAASFAAVPGSTIRGSWRRHPRLAHHRGPQRRPGFPCWEDAYP